MRHEDIGNKNPSAPFNPTNDILITSSDAIKD